MDMSAFIRRYAEESAERLREMEQGLARLETSPKDRALVDELMRQAHTVKGGARMLRLKDIQDLAHALEDAMQGVGQGKREVSPVLVDGMMAAVRGLEEMVAALDPDAPRKAAVDAAALAEAVRHGTPPPGGGVKPSGGAGAAAGEAPAGPGTGEGTGDFTTSASRTAGGTPRDRRKGGHSVRVAVSRLDALGNLTVEMTVERAREKRLHRRLASVTFSIARTRAATGADIAGPGARTAFADLERAHRRVVEESEDLLARRTALDGELRDHVQDLRMTPLSVVLDAFPASVREISRGLGKEVDLEVTGAQTELDRRIVDEVGEPLVHLVRNALDHGIEKPQERVAAGKPPRGRLAIAAWAAEGAIFVQVEDDGRGMDPGTLRRTAERRGVLTKEEAARLTDEQALDLIFMPGFTTKEVVGDLSGRGVGMDSVRAAIGRLGGSVGLHSVPGKGTRTVCRLPLTLALLRVLLFRVGEEVLAVDLRAAEWVGSFAAMGSLDYAEGEESPLPVISTAEVLGLRDGGEPTAEREPPAFVILRSGGSRAMFVVDEVLEETEIALKEAPGLFRGNRLVAGVTLLGSGDPAVVVEPSELLARALTRRALPVRDGGDR